MGASELQGFYIVTPFFNYFWIFFACAGVAISLCGCKPAYVLNESHAQTYAGSASCRECHPDAYDLWAKSNHGLAERATQPDRDKSAFVPSRTFQHGLQTTTVQFTSNIFYITSVGLSGRPEPHQADRVIGNVPLRQFLVAAPGGRWQTMEAAYDPHSNQWFNVYGNEDRQPGEWGHWTGRGMNWNAMCASCHNTRLEKKYDEATDTYHTTMVEPSVACEACHGPLQAHVDWERQPENHGRPDPNFPKLTPVQTMDLCATCHARRGDLTGNFRPGDSFFDHYELTTVDHSDLFYPDGQIRDEDYEFTAFMGSKMHQAGVTCLDCHPRSLHMPRPQGNEVCLRCHATGLLHAPIIQPEQHSHHLAGGKGDECIGCHMPVTVYMQRHPRHDHGFTIPDPLLTKKLNIPNACNRCHADKDTDWSLAAVDKWYGVKMERPTRQRAEWIAQARAGDTAAREPLLTLLATETNSYWQAVAVQMLGQWVGEAKVDFVLELSLTNRSPLVRAKAVWALEPLAAQNPAVASLIRDRLTDPLRNVRIAAAWALRAELDTNSPAGTELLHYLDFNADQPVGQMTKGNFYQSRGELETALTHFQKAVAWDTNSPPLHQQLALALSSLNRSAEAIAQLEAACRLAPKDAGAHYLLALACNEAGDTNRTLVELETTVQLDPQNGPGWYNLGLTQNSRGDAVNAIASLQHAEGCDPGDPKIPYARATILARMGRVAEAKAAAQLALSWQPDYVPALQLMQMLSR